MNKLQYEKNQFFILSYRWNPSYRFERSDLMT